ERRAGDVEPESRFRRLLLKNEEPSLVRRLRIRVAARLCRGQVEAEEGDVGLEAPVEQRMALLATEDVAAVAKDGVGGVDDGVRIAAEDLAAHQENEEGAARRRRGTV